MIKLFSLLIVSLWSVASSHLLDLPNEMTLEIYKECIVIDRKSIRNLSLVCKRYNVLADFLAHWGNATENTEILQSLFCIKKNVPILYKETSYPMALALSETLCLHNRICENNLTMLPSTVLNECLIPYSAWPLTDRSLPVKASVLSVCMHLLMDSLIFQQNPSTFSQLLHTFFDVVVPLKIAVSVWAYPFTERSLSTLLFLERLVPLTLYTFSVTSGLKAALWAMCNSSPDSIRSFAFCIAGLSLSSINCLSSKQLVVLTMAFIILWYYMEVMLL